MSLRTCKKCNIEQSLDRFETKVGWRTTKSRGRQPYVTTRHVCRKCMNKLYAIKWQKENKHKCYLSIKKCIKKYKENLTDLGVKYLLERTARYNGIKFKDITPEMIKLKRELLNIKSCLNKK